MVDDYNRALDEYKEAGVNWRHWGDARFKQLSVFLAVSAALAAAAFGELKPGSDDPVQQYALSIHVLIGTVGIGLSFLFLILEESATFYRHGYRHRAMRLEERLKYEQYRSTRNKHRPKFFLSESIFRIFFFSVAGLWTAYLWHGRPDELRLNKAITIAVAFLSVCLLVYGIRLQRYARKLYKSQRTLPIRKRFRRRRSRVFIEGRPRCFHFLFRNR